MILDFQVWFGQPNIASVKEGPGRTDVATPAMALTSSFLQTSSSDNGIAQMFDGFQSTYWESHKVRSGRD